MKDPGKTEAQLKAEALANLEERVSNYTPEQIRTPENAERIWNNFRDGVIAMSMFMIMDAEAGENEPVDHAFEYAWPLKDFARTVLTNPLPVEQVWSHYAENPDQAPTEVVLADETDWWERLTDEQRTAILDILDLQWSAIKNYEPREEDINTAHVIFRGEDRPIQDEQIEGYIAYPTVIWQPHHEIVITAVPFARSQETADGESPDIDSGLINGEHSPNTE